MPLAAFRRLAPCAALIALAAPAAVQATPASNLERVTLTSGFWSYHTSNRSRYNEDNPGIGVEAAVNTNWTIAAGNYRNSVERASTYLQAMWTPDVARTQLGAVRLSAGVAMGLVTGYPELRNGDAFPTLLPVASMSVGPVGLNLTYIPSVAGRADGAIALQFKYQLGR